MYSMEGPITIRMAETNGSPDLPAHLATSSATDEAKVVIRAADGSRTVSCDACRTVFLAAGPTAYADDRPLCDACVFEHDAQLAMVLAAVSVLRAFGASEPSTADMQSAVDLLGFARIYETFAAKHGPRREPRLPSSS